MWEGEVNEMADTDFFERLMAAVDGIELDAGEQRILKWISEWDKSTVDRVIGVIEKSRRAGIPGGLTRYDLLKIWGFLETLKKDFASEIDNAAKLDGRDRADLVVQYTKWRAEISDLQEKISHEVGSGS